MNYSSLALMSLRICIYRLSHALTQNSRALLNWSCYGCFLGNKIDEIMNSSCELVEFADI